jgi:hypothetical protein
VVSKSKEKIVPSSASSRHHVEVVAWLRIGVTSDLAHHSLENVKRRYASDTTSI